LVFSFVLEERHVARAAGRLNLTHRPSATRWSVTPVAERPAVPENGKRVVPTARALALGEPVAEILARVGACAAAAPSMRRRACAASRSARPTVIASLAVPLLQRIG